MFDKDYKVEVKNISTGQVGFLSEYAKKERYWPKPGDIRPLTFEELQHALLYQSGVRALFTNGLLYIEDAEVRQELLSEETYVKILSLEEMEEALRGGLSAIKAAVKNSAKENRQKLAMLAYEKRIMDLDIINYLTEISGINIMALINERREKEQSVATEEEPRKSRYKIVSPE